MILEETVEKEIVEKFIMKTSMVPKVQEVSGEQNSLWLYKIILVSVKETEVVRMPNEEIKCQVRATPLPEKQVASEVRLVLLKLVKAIYKSVLQSGLILPWKS